MTKPRKNHFGALIADRMARAQGQLDDELPHEEQEDSRRWSLWDFHRDLEKRVRESKAGE